MRVKDAVATCLTEAAGQYLSGETLAQKLGVSRNAVWKAVRLLQEEGFPIEAKKKTGYRLAQGIDLLTEETVRPYLHSRILGHPLYVYPELPSTNNTCKALVRDGAKHGTVVAANCQTAGKGRQGRTFVSPAGSGLYFSMILSKAVSLQDAPLLTACAAVAAARAIDALYSTQVQIKWVNDLYLHGKKFCGILTEGGVSLESGKLEHAIIGIGINIRNTSIALPEELRHTVTSLEESMPDTHVCRAQLLAAVLYAAVFGLTDPFVSWFNSENSVQMAQYAHTGMRMYFVGYFFAGFNIMAAGYLSAVNRPAEASITSICRGMVAIVACSLVLSAVFGMSGVWGHSRLRNCSPRC